MLIVTNVLLLNPILWVQRVRNNNTQITELRSKIIAGVNQ